MCTNTVDIFHTILQVKMFLGGIRRAGGVNTHLSLTHTRTQEREVYPVTLSHVPCDEFLTIVMTFDNKVQLVRI